MESTPPQYSIEDLCTKLIETNAPPHILEQLRAAAAFHTYPAPGLLIALFMVDYALEVLGAVPGEKLYAMCETQKCAPDALQVVLHCTVGNNRLTIIPVGRFAITVNRPSKDLKAEAIRVFVDDAKLQQYPVIYAWFMHDPAYKKHTMGNLLIDEIFAAQRAILSHEWVLVSVVPKKPWHAVVCSGCGEALPHTNLEGEQCMVCEGRSYYEQMPQ
jgi:formylmethanofuran dehydrogenase subunit E